MSQKSDEDYVQDAIQTYINLLKNLWEYKKNNTYILKLNDKTLHHFHVNLPTIDGSVFQRKLKIETNESDYDRIYDKIKEKFNTLYNGVNETNVHNLDVLLDSLYCSQLLREEKECDKENFKKIIGLSLQSFIEYKPPSTPSIFSRMFFGSTGGRKLSTRRRLNRKHKKSHKRRR